MAIKLFLPWEAALHIEMLDNPITRFARDSAVLLVYESAVKHQWPLKVNHFRKSLGMTPHPDERGNKFVWEEDIEKPADTVIPHVAALTIWNSIADVEEKKLQGQLTREELKEKFPALEAAAQAAADALGAPIK